MSPTYNRVVSQTLPNTKPADVPGESEGVVFRSEGPQRLEFDAITPASGGSIELQITDKSNRIVSYVSFPNEYSGRRYTFYRANGTRTTRTFPGKDANITV